MGSGLDCGGLMTATVGSVGWLERVGHSIDILVFLFLGAQVIRLSFVLLLHVWLWNTSTYNTLVRDVVMLCNADSLTTNQY